MEELFSVETVANRLGLHTRTVLRAIRDGRLKATRIGKSFRILKSDFEAFSGIAAAADPDGARATWVVDVPEVSPDTAQRLSNSLNAALMGREARLDRAQLNTAYDPGRRTLKVIAVAALPDAAMLMRHLQALIDSA